MNQTDFNTPDVKGLPQEEAALPYNPEPDQSPALAAKQKHEAELMAMDGVEGIGIAQDPIGNPAIVLYVRDQAVARGLPKDLDGVPVQVQVTGPIDALKEK